MVVQALLIPARDRLAAKIVASPARVCVIAGGPGLGKSSVLAAVSGHDAGASFASPVALRRSSDAQQMLLRQVGGVLQTIADEENVEQMARRLLSAARELAVGAAREVAVSAALRLFEIATAGVGPKVIDRLEPLRAEFAAQGARAQAEELSGFLQPEPVELLGRFLEAAVALGERSITLRLDEAQNANDAGRRLLADLADDLPRSTRLVCAWRTATEAEATTLAELLELAPPIEHFELAPLTSAQLSEWLDVTREAGFDPDEVLERTAGSPLVVADALRRGLPSSPVGAVEELVTRAIAELRPTTRDALRKLTLISRRPPPAELATITGMTDLEYAAAADELRDAGLLSVGGDEGPWLHELRRQAVIEALVAPADRPGLARVAADALAELAFADDSWQLELLALVREAKPTYRPKAIERVLLDLTWDEISVIAAHLELTDRRLRSSAIDPLLRYARDVWSGTGDLLEATESLLRLGVLAIRDEGTPRLRRREWRAGALAIIGGQCLEQLRRRPLPDLAGSVVAFGLIDKLERPNGSFARVGDADQHSLVRLAHAVLPGDSRVEPRPTLTAHLSFREVSMPLVAWYDDVERRDRAVRALRGFMSPLFGKRLSVRAVKPLPTAPAPTERFRSALARALGAARDELDEVRALQEPLSVEEALRRKLETLRTLWSLAAEDERAAMELDERIAFAWTQQERWFWEVEIHGGRRGIHPFTLATPVDELGLLTSSRMAAALALMPNERLLGPRGREPAPGDERPEIEAIDLALDRAADYNGSVPRIVIDLKSERLASQCTEALERELITAAHLRARLPLDAPDAAIDPVALTLLLPSTRDADGLWIRDEPWCVYAWTNARQTEVRIGLIGGLRSDIGDLEAAARALENFGLPRGGTVISYGQTLAEPFVAEVLGYRVEDVDLRWP